MRKDWTFYIETFGCRVNQQESEEIRQCWTEGGGREVANPREADRVLINSCAITGNAEREARNAVYRLKKAAPNSFLILAGCAAQFFDSFRPRRDANYSRPDLCLPQSRKKELFALDYALDRGASSREEPVSHAVKRSRAILKVQDGCKQNCTYCVVPQTRTALSSMSMQEAVERCRLLFSSGVSEVVISGINLRQYGQDLEDKVRFWDLLQSLDRELGPDFTGRARLRLSSIEPSMLDERALAVLTSGRIICRHLHLSLQHASPEMLRRMGRGHYRIAQVSAFLRELRRAWRNPGLGADIIVGFPGETEGDIAQLLQGMEELGLTYAHVFPYSRRPGSPAAGFSGHLPKKTKEERAAQVRAKARQLHEKFIAAQIGFPVAIVSVEQGEEGYSDNYVRCKIPGAQTGSLARGRPEGLQDGRLLLKLLN